MVFIVLAALLLSVGPAAAQAEAQAAPVVVLDVSGVINPFSARYVERGLALARAENAQLVVVTLDTPGGLETSMRDIVQRLLDTPVPTAVYVTPQGARATSAGMFILLAADVAVMAPATHVGAAHPVPLGAEASDVMDEKATSDAAALVRSLAERHGRNAAWAEDAVRENFSVIASEALEINVIDLIAEDLDDLLLQLDQQEVAGQTLRTADAPVEMRPMNFTERFFHVITEPNIAYLLLSLGTLLVLAELADPALTVAGVGAVIAYVLAFMALGSLPVNWAAIVLLVVSAGLFVLGLLTDTEPIVTFIGLVPFILGSLLLFAPFTPTSPAVPDVQVNPWVIVLVAVSIVGFSFVVFRAIMAVRRQPPRAGAERLVGQEGTALTDLDPGGQVHVEFEDWSAVAVGGNISAGERVRVTGLSGVRLKVEPVASAAAETAGSSAQDSSATHKED